MKYQKPLKIIMKNHMQQYQSALIHSKVFGQAFKIMGDSIEDMDLRIARKKMK